MFPPPSIAGRSPAWKIGGSHGRCPARMPNRASADRLTVNDRGRPFGSAARGPCVACSQSSAGPQSVILCLQNPLKVSRTVHGLG